MSLQMQGSGSQAALKTGQDPAEEIIRLQTSALEAAANGIVITDLAGKILWVNGAFATLTGYSREESIGSNTRMLNSGAQSPVFYRNLWTPSFRATFGRGSSPTGVRMAPCTSKK